MYLREKIISLSPKQKTPEKTNYPLRQNHRNSLNCLAPASAVDGRYKQPDPSNRDFSAEATLPHSTTYSTSTITGTIYQYSL